jgi:hypothetical protein
MDSEESRPGWGIFGRMLLGLKQRAEALRLLACLARGTANAPSMTP